MSKIPPNITAREAEQHWWMSSPSGRGTAGILSSCLTTILLCCWNAVCPNVPALSDSKWDQFHDKVTLAMIAFLGPEFLLGLAAGQYSSAKRSAKAFQKAKIKDWSLTYAFYADMGGMLLKIKSRNNGQEYDLVFPVNSKQVLYLKNKGHIDWPCVEVRDIDDKNKTDGLARLITVVQAIWFFANTIARAIQGLAITTLELTALSFVVIMFGTSICWIHKPADVTVPTILQSCVTLEHIHLDASNGLLNCQWFHTPLDFVEREECELSKLWAYYNYMLRILHLPVYSHPVTVHAHVTASS
ncbi:hypothetical protein J3E72DRAFT_239706 [Bipolaris maydis]|nr:hypothetical protein J3E72DRAFT_239706 [Bipolaris maydis]